MIDSRTATKQAKLHAILDAATELLVVKPTASLNDIAEEAGVGIATLHRYIDSRDHLMSQLGFRAIAVVSETMSRIQLDEEHVEAYIPQLIEELIPLGDKIYFLSHETALNDNEELVKAEQKVLEPIKHAIQLLQQQGKFRQDLSSDWIFGVLYSLLFHTWQQVQRGYVARHSAAKLLMDTLFLGVQRRGAHDE
ncbi:TetR/AcrR family transcriptional regulator [Paenibacillus sp. QZ-Y1]|uniref:TetR/AcrR family transcriptional regulator n=1 Tax=Paenibacillus sp. QZ-Y1 TaxID=3414511 RepID=UPI003F7A3D9C